MVPETDNNPEISGAEVSIEVASTLVRAMNLAAGKLFAYPEGHPYIAESFGKVESILQGIFQSRRRLDLKIAKDKVIVGSTTLDQKNPVFQRFARTLFEHSIIGLILGKGITSRELMDFDYIIAQRRNDVYQQGGIKALLTKAGIKHIQVRLIDYGLFQAQDGTKTGADDLQAPLFWESFVKGLFENTLDLQGNISKSWMNIDPETLAILLNDRFRGNDHTGQGEQRLAFQSGLKNLDLKQLSTDELLSNRFFQFIKSLNDELRQSFIATFFKFLPDDGDAAESILASLPDEIILDALKRHTDGGLYIPPNILRISQRLAAISTGPDLTDTEKDLDRYSRDELLDRLKILFKEDEVDRFIPLDYQKVLRDVIIAYTISAPELSSVPQLQKTLNHLSINTSLTSIIVNIIATYTGREIIPASLIETLKNRCNLLIENGDFHTVLAIIQTIGQKVIIHSPDGQEVKLIKLVTIFADNSFAHAVITAAGQWSKEKRADITRLIMIIGPLCIDPLLNRLADEENRALRLFYLDLLKAMGTSARDRIIEKLNDRRWYFVRNLLVILRTFNDPTNLDAIRRLSSHPHPIVRQELIHTLLALKDPQAEQMLLDEMDPSDVGRCLKAIALAGMARNRDITRKLAGFLKTKGFEKGMFEIKNAAVQALASIGDTSVLPVLQAALQSISLFSYQKSNLLKLEIVASLGKYPAGEVAPILKSIARGRPAVLAKRASLVMKTLKVDTHES